MLRITPMVCLAEGDKYTVKDAVEDWLSLRSGASGRVDYEQVQDSVCSAHSCRSWVLAAA